MSKQKKLSTIILGSFLIIILFLLFLIPVGAPKSSEKDKMLYRMKSYSALIKSEKGVIILKEKDAWGRNILYDLENKTLISWGEDGVESKDDIIIAIEGEIR